MSQSDIAISIRNLSKAYSIGHQDDCRQRTFREVAMDRLCHPFRKATKETFWALKDVALDVDKGDVVGIIGRNGAGKSTLLKILSRITKPTCGEIDVYGRVGSLLEVGTGFHSELTGRENIFLNGAILGMRRAEITRQFDAIVDFAGVERFLDTPVKRYSSGMYVRLAFAVAAHLNPEILILDEVLSVGDSEFQKKCLGKMKDVSRSGRTVLFVSHNMAAIQAMCSSCVVLKAGTVQIIGSVADCFDVYAGSDGRDDRWVSAGPARSVLTFVQVHATLRGNQPNITLDLDVGLQSHGEHAKAFIAVDIGDASGITVMQAIPNPRGFIESSQRPHNLRISIALPPLIPGRYLVSLWAGPHNSTTYDRTAECVAFEILDSPMAGRAFPHTRDHGFIVPHSTCVPHIQGEVDSTFDSASVFPTSTWQEMPKFT